MRRAGRWTGWLWLGLAGAALAGPVAAARPQRIVSLNLCADQLVVLMAEPERIVSLSHLSRDRELSFVAGSAAALGLPVNHGTVEEVLPQAPDLVLAGLYAARPAVTVLRARGVPVLDLDLPRDFADIRVQVQTVAKALGEPARGAALIGAMEATLAAAAPADPARPVALVYQANGFTAGAGTLIDSVLAAAGLDNFARRQGLVGYGYLGLETVVAGRPDLLIPEAMPPDRPSLAQQLLLHPALSAPILSAGTGGLHRLAMPGALWACGGPFTAEAVARLAEARRQHLEEAP